jgi:hypothetical protein
MELQKNMSKNTYIFVGIAIVGVLALVAFIHPISLGGIVHNAQETFDDGIAVNGTQVISSTRAISGTTGTFSTSVNPTTTQTVASAATGTVTWSQPFQGASYKKFIVYLTNFWSTATTTMTYTTAFTQVPHVYGSSVCMPYVEAATGTFNIAITTNKNCFLIAEGF